MPEHNSVAKLAGMLSGIAVLSSDVSDADIESRNLEYLVAIISEHFSGSTGLKVLTKQLLEQITKGSEMKAPVQIEVARRGEEVPSRDIDSNFTISESKVEKTTGTVDAFSEYFRDRFVKLRNFIETGSTSRGMLNNIESLKQYTNGREVSVIGMVSDKITTKNGHILVTLEDETGSAKVLFLKADGGQAAAQFEAAERLIYDDVVAVQGRISSPFVMARTLVHPNIPIRERRASEDDFAIAMISDTHVGSKFFLDKNFTSFIKWLNMGVDYRKDLAGKIKYLVVDGDLVDGIGVYPNQDRQLSVLDIYKQYSIFFDFIKSIPSHIEVFVLPGNHDAVHRSEPQPRITDDLLGDFKQDNVHIVSNPTYITMDKVSLLAYHGASLDSIIRNIPNCSYSNPEVGMTEILKRRHLSPVYGGNMIVPSKTDSLVIEKVPDILHMGHVHKNGTTEYHGTLLINSGTWQSRTEFQTKQGHLPTPSIVPVYEAKTMQLSHLDFNEV